MEDTVPQLVVLIPWDIQDFGRPEECRYFFFLPNIWIGASQLIPID